VIAIFRVLYASLSFKTVTIETTIFEGNFSTFPYRCMIRGSYDEPGNDQYKYNGEYNQQPNASFHPPFYFIIKKGRLKTCPL